MNGDNKSLHRKLQSLIDDGLSIEDAANCLGLDVDSVKTALEANKNLEATKVEDKDSDLLIAKAKPVAIKALINIGLDSNVENISARVAALRTIVDYKNIRDHVENDKLSLIYSKMQEVSSKYDKELEALRKSKSEDKTTVVVENTNTTITSPGFKEKMKSLTEKEVSYAI